MNPASIPSSEDLESPPFDLMQVPGLGSLFRWRYARPVLQAPLLVISIVMILHGLLGPSLAPKNLATTLSWLHFRGVLALIMLCAGNFFCLACPFMLVRQAARRFFRPRFDVAAGLAQQMAFGRALRTDPVFLRVVRPVVVAVVDRLADHRILSFRPYRRRTVQARFLLQVRLSDRTIQLRRLDSFAI